MGLKDYSATPANNVSAPPNGSPIGTTKVKQVDDIIRQIMADVRAYFEAPEWRDLGHTPVYATTTTFTIGGNVTSLYKAGQRVKLSDSGTLYGTISTSTFSSPNTTIEVALDSGTLSVSLSSVSVGFDVSTRFMGFAGLSGQIAASQIPTGAVIPVGSTIDFAGSTAPTGWLLCFGQAVSRTTYSDLFAVVGTTYGAGDGSTTFNLPDIRGRVVAGKDDMGGSAANRLTNAVSGVNGTSLGAAGGNQNMHQHNHGVNDPSHTHTTIAGLVGFSAAGGGTQFVSGTTNSGSATTGITIQNTGSGSSQNVQPTIIMNKIIKV